MPANSLLQQYSEERAALVQSAVGNTVAVLAGRNRVLSGILWRDNLVVTAAEGIGGLEQVGIRTHTREMTAQVIAADLTTDVAILRPDEAGAPASPDNGASASPATPATAAPGRVLRVGESIAVLGRTLRGPAALWGSIRLAGPAWNSSRGGQIDQRIELDVAFEPAFEGAAVLDMSGSVVAMAVPGPRHQVLGIPSSTIEAILAKVQHFGHLPKAYLGIRLQPLWLDDEARTRLGRRARAIAAVGGVDAGSPAESAHIELGDLLLTLDGEPAESVARLAQQIAQTTPGQTIALEVLRAGKPLTVQLTVGERRGHLGRGTASAASGPA